MANILLEDEETEPIDLEESTGSSPFGTIVLIVIFAIGVGVLYYSGLLRSPHPLKKSAEVAAPLVPANQ